jgi:hypothetical protein
VDLLYHIAGKIKTVRDISFDKEQNGQDKQASPAKSKSKTPCPGEDEEMPEEAAEAEKDDEKDPNTVSFHAQM